MTTALMENRHEEKRKKILRISRECFVKHGFHGTGMAEICVATDMSPGNLCRYFPSKSSIVMAIVDEERQHVMPIYRELQDHSDPVEGIVEVLCLTMNLLATKDECNLWIEVLAEMSRNKKVWETCNLFDEQMQDAIRKLLKKGIKSQRISPKINVNTMVLWLLAFVDGVIVRKITTPSVDIKSITKDLASNVRKMLAPEK